MKLLIGLVGEKGAGKETFGNIIIELATADGFTVSRQRFSDILNETLETWGIERDRFNLQKLAQAMDDAYGPGTLTSAVKRRFENDPADIVIADGVRWPTDEKMIKSFPNYKMLYVTAEQQIRYERSKQRLTRAGEKEKTLKDFLQEEQARNEIYIPDIGSRADLFFHNNGSLERLKYFVTDYYLRCLKKKL